jgi:hypothetical protein
MKILKNDLTPINYQLLIFRPENSEIWSQFRTNVVKQINSQIRDQLWTRIRIQARDQMEDNLYENSNK